MIGQGARRPLLFAAYALMAMEVWRGVWIVSEIDTWWYSPSFGFAEGVVVFALVLGIVSGGDVKPLAILGAVFAVWTAVGAVAWWFEDPGDDGRSTALTILVGSAAALTAVVIAVLAVVVARPAAADVEAPE